MSTPHAPKIATERISVAAGKGFLIFTTYVGHVFGEEAMNEWNCVYVRRTHTWGEIYTEKVLPYKLTRFALLLQSKNKWLRSSTTRIRSRVHAHVHTLEKKREQQYVCVGVWMPL